MKHQSGGNLKSEDVEDLNEQIGRLDGRLGKLRKSHEEVEIAALGNKDKMGMHDAD
jgi:chromosome segregation ATPase